MHPLMVCTEGLVGRSRQEGDPGLVDLVPIAAMWQSLVNFQSSSAVIGKRSCRRHSRPTCSASLVMLAIWLTDGTWSGTTTSKHCSVKDSDNDTVAAHVDICTSTAHHLALEASQSVVQERTKQLQGDRL